MAESDDQDQEKSEEPTSKREEEFREEGQVVRSQEISILMGLIAAIAGLGLIGRRLFFHCLDALQGTLQTEIPGVRNGFMSFNPWLLTYALPVMNDLAIFLVFLFAVLLLVSLSETQFLFSFNFLAPKLSHIHPIEGLKKILNSKTLIQFLKNSLKITVMSAIAYSVLKNRLEEVLLLSSFSLVSGFRWSLSLLSALGIRIGLFLLTIAILDYFYQWHTLHKKMMMSRRDLKDEMKESQVSEHVRSKVRQIQKERAKKTIQKNVPKADVIVTNPTHFAVAIRYQRHTDRAPRVVAKGMDLMAAVIRKIAKENNVPIYEYPELARGLYRKVKVGGLVPVELYEAVARVLAYIYQIHQKRKIGLGLPLSP